MRSTERLRSWTQGAKTSPRMRLASAMPNSASGCDGIAVVSSVIAECFGHSARIGAAKSSRSGAGPAGLKMPDFARYDAMLGSGWYDVASVCPRVFAGGARPGAGRLHQMRPDLGRLAARAEIVQVGPALAGRERDHSQGRPGAVDPTRMDD